MPSSPTQFYSSAYFLVNSLLILTYPILRLFTSAGLRPLNHQDSYGFTYENSIIYTVLLMSVIGYVRATGLRGFWIDFFNVGKIGVVGLLFFAKFRFCLVYIGVCVVLWMVVPYPQYRARNRFIRIKSIEQFDDIIYQFKQSKQIKIQSKTKPIKDEQQSFNYQDKYMYFIEFYADWAMPCILNKQLWYPYSLIYTTQRLKFLSVNVDHFPSIAKRFKINVSGFSKQLPTIMMLTNGEEELRFPPVDQNNKVSKVSKYDYKALLRYFDLEARYLETREIRQHGKGQEDEHKEA